MAQNQVYLIKSGENSFVEETQAIVGISGGKVGIGTTHPEADLHVTGSVKVGGDLTVDGTLTTINSTTVSVDDINIELGSTDNPTDATAEGGGITVKGDTDKTFNWHANGGWTSSENLSVADGKHFAGDELRALDAGGLSLFDTNQSGITIKGGKVGIHQAAPGYDLDVNGSGNFGSLYVDGNAVLTGEGSIFGKWEDGATQGEIFYTGGNVGVGTTNPEHNFHVVGNSVVDGNFIVNGTSGTFNVGEFDVSGSNITLNSAGGGLDSSRGGLIVNAGTNKTFQYVGGSDFWQSSESMQIVADKHLQTDKVRAIDAEGLYLQDDGENGIYIQDGGNVNIDKQLNVVGLTKADGGLNVGNGKFNIQSDGTLGSVNPNADDVIKWDGTKWVAAVSPGGGGGGTSEVPNALINSLISGESIQQITYGPYDSTPKIATDLEIVGDGSVIPYALSGVSETGYFAVFSQEIPNNNYKIHTVFGGKDVYWETGSSNSIYYNDGDVSLQRNLTVGGNLTVAGSTTSINTQTLEIEDHNIVIASNTGYNQLTDVYPVGGDYAGVFWGTGDAGAASPVSLTYQSNKGFAFEGGNVGIGITNPGSKLHVNGTIEFGDGHTIGNGGGDNLHITSSSGENIIIQASGGINAFWGQTSEHMRIDSAGNVGIGTTDPDLTGLQLGTALVVSSETGGDIVAHKSGSSVNVGDVCGSLLIANSDTDGSEDHFVGMWGKVSSTNGSQDLHFAAGRSGYEGDAPHLTIDSDGNVGIGIINPQVPLEVNGGVDNSVVFRGRCDSALSHTGSGAGNNGRFNLVAFSSDAGNDYGGGIKIQTRDGVNVFHDRMTINESGNVGIGTTNPTQALDVRNQAVVGNGTNGVKLTYSTFNSSGIIDTGFASTALEFRTGNTPAILIDSDGNVGIGTTNPGTNKLYVSGNIYANGTITPSSDDRVKHNEQNIVGAIETLGKITPKKYIKTADMYEADHNFELDEDGNPVDANGEPVEHSIEAGVIAQQVLGVPELAFMVSPEGVDEDGNVTSPHGLNYNSLFTYAIAAIQEQQAIIEDLKSRIETLESK